jgi:oligoendopeptidase F
MVSSISFSKKESILQTLKRLTTQPPNSTKHAEKWFLEFQRVSEELSDMQLVHEMNIQKNLDSRDYRKQMNVFENKILLPSLHYKEILLNIFLTSEFTSNFFNQFENDSKLIPAAVAFEKILRSLQNKQKIVHNDILILQNKETETQREYKTFFNSSRAEFLGRSTTLPILLGKTNDSNLSIRKESFRTFWNFVLNNKIQFEIRFQKLLENRIQQASICGLRSYSEFAHTDLGRTDYSLKESQIFCENIEVAVVPLLSHFFRTQGSVFFENNPCLPWNFSVSEKSGFPSGVITLSQSELNPLLIAASKHMGENYTFYVAELLNSNYVDLYPRPGKAGGAFCMHLAKQRKSLVFANFGGSYKDFSTVLHEIGHAIHGHLSSPIQNHLLRSPPIEFSEFAALSFETIGGSSISAKAKQIHALQILLFLPVMAKIYLWQAEVYDKQMLDAHDREKLWIQLGKRFTPFLDWSGCAEWEGLGWLSRPHVFSNPLYFVEYGYAYLGVCQLWQSYETNLQRAQSKFEHALSLGATKSLPGLFEAAGLNWDTSPKAIAKTTQFLLDALRDS